MTPTVDLACGCLQGYFMCAEAKRLWAAFGDASIDGSMFTEVEAPRTAFIGHFWSGVDLDPDACLGCRCTNERACPGGCFWVAPNVCSACVEPNGRG